jgi:glycosyltransferase involved in cell wall biosynthesis
MNASSRYVTAETNASRPRLRVAIVVNFLTTYRADFYRRLLANEEISVTIYCHEAPPHLNIPTIHQQFPEHVRVIRGFFSYRERVVVSSLPWRELFTAYDAVYVEGNPRYLSLALLATLLRVTRRKVIMWAMVHSFRNSRTGHAVRLLWYRLFDQLLVYSEKEVAYLTASQFAGRIVSIDNGIDYDRIEAATNAWPQSRLSKWRASQQLSNSLIVLSCARLEQKNKFSQFLDIFPKLIETHPNVVWCIIGEGSDRGALESKARHLGVTPNVRFLGRIYDEAEQAPWFLSSRVLVHPGAIGLTLLHAMAFGLPVVTHDNARHHGPEFSIMRDGETGITHPEDTPDDMLKSVRELLQDPVLGQYMGTAGRHLVKTKYNTQAMVRHFLEFLEPPLATAAPRNR